jgi:hypothetical protein
MPQIFITSYAGRIILTDSDLKSSMERNFPTYSISVIHTIYLVVRRAKNPFFFNNTNSLTLNDFTFGRWDIQKELIVQLSDQVGSAGPVRSNGT